MKNAVISKAGLISIIAATFSLVSCGQHNPELSSTKSASGDAVIGNYPSATKKVYSEVLSTLRDMQRAGVGQITPNSSNGLTLTSSQGFNIDCNNDFQGSYCILAIKNDGPVAPVVRLESPIFIHTAPVSFGFNSFLAARLDANPSTIKIIDPSGFVLTKLVDSAALDSEADVIECAKNNNNGVRSCGFSRKDSLAQLSRDVVIAAARGR
ncbi:MAG: hypothetical protein NT027_02055 [Proteobacteria bacterium]|nr:hypothetical protein [Pseudomonadota bacterium]